MGSATGFLDFARNDEEHATHSAQIKNSPRRSHGASLDYEGSLTVSADLAELVGLIPYEKILVSNLSNGQRFETYAIFGEARRGIIELNGATAHLGKIGDRLTIMSFARYTLEEAALHTPRITVLNKKNEVVRYEGGDSAPSLRIVGK
ncbi:MAG TPA: aspartate 1-decarboxylase [Candidatus Udaeobacter sp.]|nr:aspartate 1-decarboxylase [Candidatus Udaeobacter sp.]